MPSNTNIVFVGRRRFSLAQTDSLLMRMRSVASDELHQMMQRRMSQENPIRANETEFVQRLQKLIVLAVNRLIYHGTALVFLPCLSILILLLLTNSVFFFFQMWVKIFLTCWTFRTLQINIFSHQSHVNSHMTVAPPPSLTLQYLLLFHLQVKRAFRRPFSNSW